MFSSVTSSMTNWFSGETKGSDVTPDTDENKENKPETTEESTESCKSDELVAPPDTESGDSVENEKMKDLAAEAKQALEDVSAKAKEWGSMLYSFGKTAGKTVADTAIQITKSVEEKTFLGEFQREQNKFVGENQEKSKHSEAAVPPWIGYNEEETMKNQILALSQDKRNFLRNPPAGVQFNFDFQVMHPVAIATLQEDTNLEKMRFELVPKQVKEEMFWRNYFYRVSLIKQSTQLTSLALETGSTGERSSGSSRRSSTGSENKEKNKQVNKQVNPPPKEEEFAPGSPQENEFVSDAFQDNEISAEDVRKEMQMLGVEDQEKDDDGSSDTELPQWEKDLQKELQDYEMVNEGMGNDDELENEILQQIEEETKAMT